MKCNDDEGLIQRGSDKLRHNNNSINNIVLYIKLSSGAVNSDF